MNEVQKEELDDGWPRSEGCSREVRFKGREVLGVGGLLDEGHSRYTVLKQRSNTREF